MQFWAGEKKLKVEEVPITTNYDDEVKRNPVKHGVSILMRVLRLILKGKWLYEKKSVMMS